MLSKDVSKLSDRVADYTEIETHNTDLQSELFARDRYIIRGGGHYTVVCALISD